MKTESEKKLEAALVRDVAKMGGLAVKLTSQFHRGLPDRLVLLPGGRADFVELKSTGKKPTDLQLVTHGRLRAMGFGVKVIDNAVDLAGLLAGYRDLIGGMEEEA